MTENKIFIALRTALLNGMSEPLGLEVRRSYQPTQQGADFQPTLYIHLISQRRYGYLERNDIPDGDVIRHVERQYYETVIQFTGQVLEKADTSLTSVDLLNEAAYVLQSDQGRLWLQEQGISILRVDNIRQIYATDEQERFQSSPNFDLTIITQQVKETTSPITISVELKQHRI